MSFSLHLSKWKSKASKEKHLLKYGTFKIFQQKQLPVKISKGNGKPVRSAHLPTFLPARSRHAAAWGHQQILSWKPSSQKAPRQCFIRELNSFLWSIRQNVAQELQLDPKLVHTQDIQGYNMDTCCNTDKLAPEMRDSIPYDITGFHGQKFILNPHFHYSESKGDF